MSVANAALNTHYNNGSKVEAEGHVLLSNQSYTKQTAAINMHTENKSIAYNLTYKALVYLTGLFCSLLPLSPSAKSV